MSPLPSSSRSLKSVQESLALKSSDWNIARTSSSSKKVLGFFTPLWFLPIHTHRDPGRAVKSRGTAALPEIFRSLRSCMILHAKKTILDHISLLTSSWLGPPPPLGAWGLALGHLHIMIVRIETSSLSSYVSVFFNKLLRTANCEQPEKVAR